MIMRNFSDEPTAANLEACAGPNGVLPSECATSYPDLQAVLDKGYPHRMSDVGKIIPQ